MRSLRVLLVEDDPDHVFLVRRALADLPGAAVTVEVAGDGEQAMELLGRIRAEEATRDPRWATAGPGPRPRGPIW